ncbi:MAG: bifunctional polysaccharide deacetylase/glycosyltransferase family 2 protein [Mycetocola sp.]
MTKRPATRRLREPRGHWWLTGLLMVVVAAALLAHGFIRREVGGTGTMSRDESANAGLTTSGAVLDLSGPEARTNPTPSGVVALTFDDGPDPRWTPQILDILERHRVPATFFLVGSAVLDHPELSQRIVREGHEIGAHTLTHADVTNLSGWLSNLQLSLTQTALAGATGRRTVLFRPPYSSTPADVTVRQLEAYTTVASQGYLIVLSDVDSEDWRRPGVGTIIANATPPSGTGGIVLFHDGGGDREQTVAALDRYITDLTADGYRFVTVSEIAELDPAATQLTTTPTQRWQGDALRFAVGAGTVLTSAATVLLPLLGALALIRTVMLLGFARRHRRDPARHQVDVKYAPRVAIIVPAYNEAAGIEAAVSSLAQADYPNLRVIVVDDGSTDGTAHLARALELPNVRVVMQTNQGKPAALNTGLALADEEVIVTVDGDTVFEPDTVKWLVQRFADPAVGAISGNTKVANRHGILGQWQHIEYVMGFNLDRRMYELARCMPTVPGAIGAFRRQALVDVGGVSSDTLAEDTDLTMAIGRAGWHVVYEERARAWTEAPATLGQLWKQRYRWSYGTMQSMWKHRGTLRPSARSPLGRRALPYMAVFQVFLPMLAPIIDLFAVYGLLFLDWTPVICFWLAFNALQLAVGVYAFRMDGERLRPLWTMPLQQFVYRQLMYLVVIHSAVTALTGAPLRWHKMHRSGDFSAAPKICATATET